MRLLKYMGLVLQICGRANKNTACFGLCPKQAVNRLQLVKRTESVPLLFPIIDKFA